MKSFFFIGGLFFASQLVSQKNTHILPSPIVCIEQTEKLYFDSTISVDFSKISPNLIEQLKILGSVFHKLTFVNDTNSLIKFSKLKNVIQDSSPSQLIKTLEFLIQVINLAFMQCNHLCK